MRKKIIKGPSSGRGSDSLDSASTLQCSLFVFDWNPVRGKPVFFTRWPMLSRKDSLPDDICTPSLFLFKSFFPFFKKWKWSALCTLECTVHTNPISRCKAGSEPVIQQQHRAAECSLGEAARLHALIMRLLARTHCFPPVARGGIAELIKK